MPEDTELTEGQETLSILRRLEGVVFAGQITSGVTCVPTTGCSCEDCACYSRSGDHCECNPWCACKGRTAISLSLDEPLNSLLGLAAVLPIEDVKTLVGLRDKVHELEKKHVAEKDKCPARARR